MLRGPGPSASAGTAPDSAAARRRALLANATLPFASLSQATSLLGPYYSTLLRLESLNSQQSLTAALKVCCGWGCRQVAAGMPARPVLHLLCFASALPTSPLFHSISIGQDMMGMPANDTALAQTEAAIQRMQARGWRRGPACARVRVHALRVLNSAVVASTSLVLRPHPISEHSTPAPIPAGRAGRRFRQHPEHRPEAAANRGHLSGACAAAGQRRVQCIYHAATVGSCWGCLVLLGEEKQSSSVACPPSCLPLLEEPARVRLPCPHNTLNLLICPPNYLQHGRPAVPAADAAAD